MAVQIQLRRGSTTDHTSFIGALGEVTMDTTKNVLVVHNNSTAGGFPLALASGSAIVAASLLVNNNLNISTGNAYQINGVAVLSTTTLGNSVVNSSLTSVGTLTNLTVTNTIVGSVNGNAATATALQTARNINGVSFNGTADITVTAAAGTLTGTTLASGVTASSLTSVGTLSSLTVAAKVSANNVGTAVSGFSDYLNGGAWDILGASTAGGASTLAIGGYRSSQWIGIDFYTGGVSRALIDNSGNLAVDTNTLFVDAVNNRVGVGTASPATGLHLLGAASANADFTHETVSAGTAARTRYLRGGSLKFLAGLGAYTGGDTYEIAGPSAAFVTIDASGNLGLGVTPSAWSGRTAIQLPDNAYVVSSGPAVLLGANVYFNGVNRTYISNGVATDYRQINGEHRWEYAASGTAGNAITFTQAMTLDASGNLGVGTTSPGSLGLIAAQNNQTADTAIVVSNNGTATATTTMSFVFNEGGVRGWFRRYRDGTGNTEIGFSDNLLFTGNVTSTKVERMRLDGSGNVGIGTSAPFDTDGFGRALDIRSTTGGQVIIRDSDDATRYARFAYDGTDNSGWVEATGTGSFLRFRTAGSQKMLLDASGNLAVDTNTLYVDAVNNRVGVGTASPAVALDVVGRGQFTNNGFNYVLVDSTVSDAYLRLASGGTVKWYIRNNVSTSHQLEITPDAGTNTGLVLNQSGNLGLGVTPSPWSGGRAIEVGFLGNCLWGFGANELYQMSNAYFNAGFKYAAAGTATIYLQFNGTHQWFTASSGAKDAAITIGSAKMMLDANGNLGVGTSNPSAYGAFAVFSAGIGLHNNSTSGAAGLNLYEGGSGRFSLRTLNGSAGLSFFDSFNGVERARLDASGNLAVDTNVLYVDAVNNRVGVGTASPGYSLDVVGFGRFSSGAIGSGGLTLYGDASSASGMVLTTSGNLGLGVTPSAWNTYRALDVAGGGGFISANNAAEIWSNAFFDGAVKYKANGFATRYHANSSGAHAWYNAPSNSSGAGAACTFTQAMTLDASGYLGVGTSSPNDRLEVAGALRIQGSNSGATVPALGTNAGRLKFLNGGVYGLLGDVLTNGDTYLQSGRIDGSSSAYNLLLNPLGGNIGIGTSSPAYRLQVNEVSGADRDVFAAQVAGASNGFQVKWKHSTTKTHVIITDIPTSSAGLPAGTLYSDGGTIKIA